MDSSLGRVNIAMLFDSKGRMCGTKDSKELHCSITARENETGEFFFFFSSFFGIW